MLGIQLAHRLKLSKYIEHFDTIQFKIVIYFNDFTDYKTKGNFFLPVGLNNSHGYSVKISERKL